MQHPNKSRQLLSIAAPRWQAVCEHALIGCGLLVSELLAIYALSRLL
ncbi:MAG: hypothetical protein JNK87_29060 [Bryobacterales bacterium]|nr:hypothetical protein [Bryobacterales bacterium]